MYIFAALSTTCEPEELVRILNDLFARFDKLASVSPKTIRSTLYSKNNRTLDFQIFC